MRITLRGTYMPVHGMTHRHATAEPGTVEHSHLGGGVPHDHDPETGFQVKICPVCGEEIDADDDGCPDEGDTASCDEQRQAR